MSFFITVLDTRSSRCYDAEKLDTQSSKERVKKEDERMAEKSKNR